MDEFLYQCLLCRRWHSSDALPRRPFSIVNASSILAGGNRPRYVAGALAALRWRCCSISLPWRLGALCLDALHPLPPSPHASVGCDWARRRGCYVATSGALCACAAWAFLFASPPAFAAAF